MLDLALCKGVDLERSKFNQELGNVGYTRETYAIELINKIDWPFITLYMDDELRELLHLQYVCTDNKVGLLVDYCWLHWLEYHEIYLIEYMIMA